MQVWDDGGGVQVCVFLVVAIMMGCYVAVS